MDLLSGGVSVAVWRDAGGKGQAKGHFSAYEAVGLFLRGEGMPADRRSRKRKPMIVFGVMIAAFAWTWLAGPGRYARDLEDRARRTWKAGLEMEEQIHQKEAEEGLPSRKIVFPGGPYTEVRWCYPILPFVLLADSRYSIGPLWGKTGVKIVIFYGFSTADFDTPWTSIS